MLPRVITILTIPDMKVRPKNKCFSIYPSFLHKYVKYDDDKY